MCLQYATHCNALQHTATHCNTLQHTKIRRVLHLHYCKTMQHTVTRYNTSRNGIFCVLVTATHCNTLQHTATHCSTQQFAVTHRNALQHKKRRHPLRLYNCDTLQHTVATHRNTQRYDILCVFTTATHCNALQHTATHRDTPQYTKIVHPLRLYHSLPLTFWGVVHVLGIRV